MKSRDGKNILAALVVMALVGMLPANLFATALTAARDTPEKDLPRSVALTVKSNVVIYAGSLVCVDSSGYANPAADTSGFAVIGRADATVDNRTAVYLATRKVSVSRGVFRWENADSIAAADIGSLVYVTDDATVNKTGGGQNIIAGSVYDVDDDGVWVDTGKVGPSGAATPSSLAVTGAATVGTTLTVTGSGSIGSALTVTGAQTNSSTLRVVGAATLNNLTVNTNATVTGNLAVTGTQAFQGATTANNLTVNTNATVGGTLGVTGIATFTAIPNLNATRGTAGAVSALMTNAPTSMTADATWIPIGIGGTNYWFPAFLQP